MDPQQQFCLKWNSFSSNLVTAFDNLFKSESLTDVSLFCEGKTFKAHKLILAACSKHFQEIFEATPLGSSLIVILDGTSSTNMASLLEFMYRGEVQISQERLSSFLKTADNLQVKGLSFEYDKLSLTSQREQGNSENKTSNDSPRPKQNGSAEAQLPSTSFSPLPYITCHYRQTTGHSEQHPSSPDPQRNNKRAHHNNPNTTPVSDSLGVRASVLRDGSRPERESPLSLTYSSHSSAHLENSHQPQTNNTGPVDATTSSHHYRNVTTNNCGEDLRIKSEPATTAPNSGEFPKNTNATNEWKTPDNGTTPPSPSNHSWKIDTSHKNVVSTLTPDGKKLQCPYCERLYGYETNLRAHIRQRHQGIRVPCPFCARTFTRNNTVRRHIAREHKTEIAVKSNPTFPQTANHNQ
jgi:hypothetical protein